MRKTSGPEGRRKPPPHRYPGAEDCPTTVCSILINSSPMKTRLLFTACALALTTQVLGQDGLYAYTRVLQGDGYAYKCDVPEHKLVTLYNIKNERTYLYCMDKRTGKMYSPKWGDPYLIEPEEWILPTCYSIVNQAFTPETKAKDGQRLLNIVLYIDPQKGNVMEVTFRFLSDPESIFWDVPTTVFRNMELEFKKLKFKVTEEAKNLNHVLFSWNQDPSETIKYTLPSKPLNPGGSIGGDGGPATDWEDGTAPTPHFTGAAPTGQEDESEGSNGEGEGLETDTVPKALP